MARFLVIIGLFLFLSSCSKDDPSVFVSNQSDPLVEVSDRPQDLDLEPFVELETRGVYCNLCSTVKILIYPNRKATFEGEYHERTKEASVSYEKRISSTTRELTSSEYSNLDQLVANMNFFDLANEYVPNSGGSSASTSACGGTHGQKYAITVRNGSRLKSVRHYAGCESDEGSRLLPTLEKYILSLFEADKILQKSVLANTNTASR